jgi:transposase-like protein
MEADVEGLIGAARRERSADRLDWRNGYRERTLDTRLSALSLKIPKLRQGTYFPPFLEARKTTEKPHDLNQITLERLMKPFPVAWGYQLQSF